MIKLFLLITLAALSAAQGPNPVVRVTHGVLQGSWKVSSKGRSYASFQGVPYARPPIGKYRFRSMQANSNRTKASPAQLSCLAEHMQNHPSMASGLSQTLQGRVNLELAWQNLATKLNSLGGPIKTPAKWKQAWRDLRNNTKRKASHNYAEHRGYGPGSTGNGPPHIIELTQVEEQVLSVMGPVSVYGMEEIPCTEEPQQLKPWLGVWDATRPLSACLQYDPFEKKITGSENCLFVNVATPQLSPTASLPVVIFIHGGAFMYGHGDIYDPSNLMDKDVVVVTLNYRLGPLGFLSTGDEIAPGNNGLKDQSFALHWVKNNIMMFGGNPDSITLTGCSAGGASVHYHYLSPLSRGTFNRGIAFSGAAFASWTHSVKPAQKAKTLGTIVGCPITNNKEMIDCLKYRPAEVVVNAQAEMLDWKVHLFTPFTPTTEASGVREPFLSQYPYHAAISGSMMNVPLITSVTSEEGLYPAAVYQTDPVLLQELETNWEQLASNIFEYNDTLPLNMRSAVASKIKQHYLGGKPVGQDTYKYLVQALGDRLFAVEVGRLAQIHALKSGQPTYVYRYAYHGTISLANMMGRNDKDFGVCHADDVLRIFKFPYMDVKSAEDAQMVEALVDLVYSYASTGVPKFNNVQLLPVTPGSNEITYLNILSPTTTEVKSSSDFGQRSFWDNLGFVENEKYHIYLKDEL